MRTALGISYHGHGYTGWQSQPAGTGVQDLVEAALTAVAPQPNGSSLRVVCSGRTDTGVHALNQVVHFDSAVYREPQSWVRACNAHLPKDISVQWAHNFATLNAPIADEEADSELLSQAESQSFHARFAAEKRRYVYVLYTHPVRPALMQHLVGWQVYPLDFHAMRAAAAYFVGEHDFSSFRSSQCQAKSPIKTLYNLEIRQSGAFSTFEFTGNAFLHHMIRNIMGTLIAVGQGKQPPYSVKTLIEAKNRKFAAPTFMASGLYFLGPQYAEHWDLPSHTQLTDLSQAASLMPFLPSPYDHALSPAPCV